MTYSTEVLADSPWAFWKTDETSGTSLADSSGNSRPMAITGAPTLAQTGPNAAVADAIAWPSSVGTEHYAGTTATLSTSNVTFEAWVYLTANPTAQTPVVASGVAYGTGGVDKYLYIDTSGILRWYIFNGGQVTVVAGSALSLNAWHHIVASTGAAGTKIRVDKTNLVTSGNTGTTTNSAKIFIHGGGIDGTSGNAIDATNGSAIKTAEVAVYASQLSDARTDAHYDAMVVAATIVVPRPGLATAIAQAPSWNEIIPVASDTTNAGDGRSRGGIGVVEMTYPVDPVPPGLTLGERVDKVAAYPTPTMVNGRPT